jgi:hypothetical protein
MLFVVLVVLATHEAAAVAVVFIDARLLKLVEARVAGVEY